MGVDSKIERSRDTPFGTILTNGLADRVANIIGVGGFRMLGPIFTGAVLSGFAGASIAAELGTMVVTEEVDALRVMGLSPRRFLVAPRFAAMVVALPCLAIISDLAGITGGFVSLRGSTSPAP